MPLADRSERIRGSYVGGREAAAISGIGRDTPLDVYARIVKGVRTEMNGPMLRGTLMEPGIAEWVCARRLVAEQAVRDAFYVDAAVPYFAGSVDIAEAPVAAPRIIHEIKTTRARGRDKWGQPGTPEVEPTCYAQISWYMGLSGAERAHVWLYDMDADEDPIEYVVPRDDRMISMLRRNAEDFWFAHILTETPPAPSANTDSESIAAVWPAPVAGREVPPSVEAIQAAVAYAAARDREKAAKEEKDDAAGKLKAFLGDAERSVWPGGAVSWAATNLAAKVDWEQAIHELAQEVGMKGEAFDALIHKHTIQTRSTRSLRVTLKKGGAK